MNTSRLFRSIKLKKPKWDKQFKKKNRIKFIFGFVNYLLFLIATSAVALNLTGPRMYFFTNAIKLQFIDKQFINDEGIKRNFNEILIIKHIWKYMENVLIPGMEWINSNSKLLGKIRVRQARVRSGTCRIHEVFIDYFKNCSGSYNAENADRKNFITTLDNMWKYYSQQDLGEISHWGYLATYPGDGYVEDLVQNTNESLAVINKLAENHWIDHDTRAVFVQFSLYNANINMFGMIKLVIELSATGGILPSYEITAVKLLNVNNYDVFIYVCELLVIFLIVWHTLQEILEILMKGFRKYFILFWNWIDFIIIIVVYFCVGISIYRKIIAGKMLSDLEKKPMNYLQTDTLTFWHRIYVDLVAVGMFLIWLKILTFIGISKIMIEFSRTISQCCFHLLGYGFMFAIILLAYAQMGYIFFGIMNPNFKTVTDSTFTLMKTIVGDFDYLALKESHYIMGPIYFLTFISFVFFVLLHIFLAIINETYCQVKGMNKNIKPNIIFVRNLSTLEELDDYDASHQMFTTNLGRNSIELMTSEEIRDLKNRIYDLELSVDMTIDKLNDLLKQSRK